MCTESWNQGQRFGALHDNLKLPADQLGRARTFHREMDGHLIDAGIAVQTRLQGSLARATMLPPLHDIDKVVELHPDLEVDLAGPDGPERAVGLVREAVEPHLPGAFFVVKKHALGITLPDEDFAFDAVPAFPTIGDDKWIRIADTKAGEWKPSNTYDLIDTIATRNQLCLGRFVHQVRMVKQAVVHAGLDLPGLHTETFCYQVITSLTAHPEAVAAALAAGAELLAGPYCEATGVDRISDRLDEWVKVTARQGLQRLADLAAQAIDLAVSGDEAAAGEIWADIFGDDVFPRPSAEADEKKFLAGLWAGASVGAGQLAKPTRTTRAWRPA